VNAQVSPSLVEYVWTQDRVAVPNGSPTGVGKNGLASILFGNDEFAGDREIAYFLDWVTRAAEPQTAASPTVASFAAATTGLPAEGSAGVHAAEGRLSSTSPETRVTLVAVPVHTGNPSCRYNPYHLRIVGREGDKCGVRDGEEDMGERLMLDGSQDVYGVWETDLPLEPSPRASGIAGLTSAGGAGREYQGQDQASVNDRSELVEEEIDDERVYFSSKGVTLINIHGETSFHGLEEWRREKDRFDTLSRMKFVRR